MFEKFRVWDTKNKRYGLPVYVEYSRFHTTVVPPAGGHYEIEVITPYKAGETEIFAGDIVSFNFLGTVCTGKVEFSEKAGQFLVTDGKNLNVPLHEVVTLDGVTVTQRTKSTNASTSLADCK